MVENKNKNAPLNPMEEKTPREVYLTEKEEQEAQARILREQQAQDRSLREGVGYLFQVVILFIFYVVIGAFVFMFGRDLVATQHPFGFLLILAGGGLIVKGMMYLGGSNSK